MPRRPLLACLAATVILVAGADPAQASPYVRYGLHDDSWLIGGPGTLESRVSTLKRLGVGVVRFNLAWHAIARKRPGVARDPADPAYDWRAADAVLPALRDARIATIVGVHGTPSWANGGLPPNWAPRSKFALANFAYAAAKRYPWVRQWLIWNEPNQRKFLRPTLPQLYTRRLLNPAYRAIHLANPRARVAGGVTAPRGGRGGVSPVRWIRGMRSAGARLDAYAHHPYPLRPRFETPWSGGCSRCATITMATLGRLLAEVRRNFGYKRIWLTEYGYQTNPPDRMLGVSYALQSRYIGEAARRARVAPRVDFLIHFLYRDELALGRWQSGLVRANGAAKPALRAFRFPLAQVSRRGLRTVVWGQVRPGSGRRAYQLQRLQRGRWRAVGATRLTDSRGYFTRVVRAGRGVRVRTWSPSLRASSPPLRIK